MRRPAIQRPSAVAAAALSAAAVGVALAACAPRQPGVARTDVGSVVDDRGQMVTTSSVVESRLDTLAVPVAQAMSAVTAAYTALGLPPNTVLPDQHLVGVRNVTVSRLLQGVPMGNYLDCGSDMGVPLTASGRVQLTLTTEVRPAGTASQLVTTLQARALRTSSGAQLDPVPCSSRGTLEAKLNRVAREQAP